MSVTVKTTFEIEMEHHSSWSEDEKVNSLMLRASKETQNILEAMVREHNLKRGGNTVTIMRRIGSTVVGIIEERK